MKALAKSFLCAIGLPVFARRRHRGKIAVLMYHGVEAEPLWPPCSYVIDAATLRRQLEYLKRHFNVLALEEALTRMRAGTLPDRAVVLTFDDGTRNLATHAAPILRELELPAAIFLATGPMGSDEVLWPDRLWLGFAATQTAGVDLRALGMGHVDLRDGEQRGTVCAAVVERLKDLPDAERMAHAESVIDALSASPANTCFELLSWEEARAMAVGGLITLYPHTVSHPILSRCSDDKVSHEIAESCAAVARETARRPAVFAYPNGRPQDFDERARTMVRREGVEWALATVQGYVHPDSDALALPRMGIGSQLSFSHFRLLVSGAFQ